ncbi:MAG TPA: hypothetical protein VFT22_17810 [Kofleriaceae bacterium]|nr:hypothetical protein [Kofleriaceae bacterium]
MMTLETILEDADRALSDAQHGEPDARREAATRFMRAFDHLAREIAAGRGSWDRVRRWARGVSARVCFASAALADWQSEMGLLFYGHGVSERDIAAALDRRSQHAFAREAFRGTSADPMLAGFEDDEADEDFHDEAERLKLDPPSWVPRSHTWWSWSN